MCLLVPAVPFLAHVHMCISVRNVFVGVCVYVCVFWGVVHISELNHHERIRGCAGRRIGVTKACRQWKKNEAAFSTIFLSSL